MESRKEWGSDAHGMDIGMHKGWGSDAHGDMDIGMRTGIMSIGMVTGGGRWRTNEILCPSPYQRFKRSTSDCTMSAPTYRTPAERTSGCSSTCQKRGWRSPTKTEGLAIPYQ